MASRPKPKRKDAKMQRFAKRLLANLRVPSGLYGSVLASGNHVVIRSSFGIVGQKLQPPKPQRPRIPSHNQHCTCSELQFVNGIFLAFAYWRLGFRLHRSCGLRRRLARYKCRAGARRRAFTFDAEHVAKRFEACPQAAALQRTLSWKRGRRILHSFPRQNSTA